MKYGAWSTCRGEWKCCRRRMTLIDATVCFSCGARHKPSSHPVQSPSRRLRRALQKTRNPVHRAAQQNVGEKRQDEGHDQRLQWVEPAKDNYLIDEVNNDGESE